MNTFGRHLRVTTWGESHGPAIGCVVDGVPAGVAFDHDLLRHQMQRRRPGQSNVTTARDEKDTVQVLSGVYNNVTTGGPISLLIKNKNQRSADYDTHAAVYRPGHADYTYHAKYGQPPLPGGGRASARETATRVAAGAVARMWLQGVLPDLRVVAAVTQIGDLKTDIDLQRVTETSVDAHPTRCPDTAINEQMTQRILAAQADGDSLGGVVSGCVTRCPVGLGEPVFEKLQARLGGALLSIPATKGIEFGLGFASCALRGSNANDAFVMHGDTVSTATNHHGGTLGGISTGQPITFRLGFKPPSSIKKPQQTVTHAGKPSALHSLAGRHDPCVVPRAVPIVEAMTWLVLADLWMAGAAQRNCTVRK